MRHGKGKLYNNHGKLEFEGEFVCGKKWNGKGNEYSDYGRLELEFEGGAITGKKINKKISCNIF